MKLYPYLFAFLLKKRQMLSEIKSKYSLNITINVLRHLTTDIKF